MCHRLASAEPIGTPRKVGDDKSFSICQTSSGVNMLPSGRMSRRTK